MAINANTQIKSNLPYNRYEEGIYQMEEQFSEVVKILLFKFVSGRVLMIGHSLYKQENTHTGADSSSVNNIPLSDYQHCNIR